MSHIVSIETEIRDLAAARAACKRLGWEFQENQTTYAWYGVWMGDSDRPADLNVDDMGKCDHAIRVPGAKYEAGLCRVGNAYRLRYDYWYSGGLETAMGGKAGERFLQAYAVEAAKIAARKAGHAVSETTLTDGTVKLTIQTG